MCDVLGSVKPIPNLWAGVTAENQERADERIPFLLKTPAAVRFVSIEPILGPVDLNEACDEWWESANQPFWVIVGAETGPGARTCRPEWIGDLVWQCQEAGVACFVKQIRINGKISKDVSEWPEQLCVREWPVGADVCKERGS
jgi:protein gp37